MENVMRAEGYYKLVGKKDVEGIKKYLHPDVEFYGPLATLKGKEAVIQATSGFMNAFESLVIRTKFGSGEQAMIVYDTDIPGIAKSFPGASLLTFRDGLIVKIELFYDASRFAEKKKEIFS
ncbi:MAG: nuclear transport factor 2 family protein [Parachlamydiales bacterium]|nr:nuclear transport factor 2 family protein [Parachlamydiales bacterium]